MNLFISSFKNALKPSISDFDHTFCLLVALVGAVCLLQIAEVLPAEAVLVLQAYLKYSILTSRGKYLQCLYILKSFENFSQCLFTTRHDGT